MTQASNLRPAGVSRRSRRGARSRNRGSIRFVYRSGGSTMWESAEMSLWVIIATLLLGQGRSGREPGCLGHRRVAARYARARPLSKPRESAYLIEGVRRRISRLDARTGAYTSSELVLRAIQTWRQLRVVVCDGIADLITRESLRFGEVCLDEIRLGEVRLREIRSGEVGCGEVRPGEVGLGENRLGEVGLGEVRRGEVRPREVRQGEVCSGEARPGQGSADELRFRKVRSSEIRSGEVHAAEVGTGELRPGEGRLGEARPLEVYVGEVRP